MTDVELVRKPEVGEGQRSAVGVAAHQCSWRKMADTDIERHVSFAQKRMLPGGIEFAAYIERAKTSRRRLYRGRSRTAIDAVEPGCCLKPLLLKEQCDGFGRGQVEVDSFLL